MKTLGLRIIVCSRLAWIVVLAFFGFSVDLSGAHEVTVSTHALSYFEALDQDQRGRSEMTARISADGTKLVFTRRCTQDTSLSGLLSSGGTAEAMGGIYLMDLTTGAVSTLFAGRYGNRPNGGIASVDAQFTADITGDGSKVIAAIAHIALQPMGEDGLLRSDQIKVIAIDTVTHAVTEIQSIVAQPGHYFNLKVSQNGSWAIFSGVPPTGEKANIWGVEFSQFHENRELYSIALAGGGTVYQISDNGVDYDLGGFPHDSTDISADGQRIIYALQDHQTWTNTIITAKVDGTGKQVISSGLNWGHHVGISGDGATIAYSHWGSDGADAADDVILLNAFAGGQERELLVGEVLWPGLLRLDHTGSALAFTGGLGDASWYWRSYFLLTAEPLDTLTSLHYGIQSATPDLGTVVTQNSGAPVYLSKISVTQKQDPVDAWYGSDATALDGGWIWSPWLGYFAVRAESDWVFHLEHGWMYPIGTDVSVWLWSQSLGWIWTARLDYPYVYSVNHGAWLFYELDSSDPRWFINLATRQWFAVP